MAGVVKEREIGAQVKNWKAGAGAGRASYNQNIK